MSDSTTTVHTTVNGRQMSLEVRNRATLADVLRDDLGLLGVKVSCRMQVCGACTVLVDGAPVSACTYLGAGVDGREVQTVEGLADGESLHEIQQSFIDCSAFQCGFCTPGFIMATKALLDDDPAPEEDAVVHHLDGNICRCTGYQPIVAAVMDAAGRLRGRQDD